MCMLAVRVTSLDGKDVAAVSAGSGHFMALTAAGEVYTWATENGSRSATGTLTRNSGLPGSSTINYRRRTIGGFHI